MGVEVVVTSDFICPWCLVGERRLRKAIASLPAEVEVKLSFRPFELNPDMPPEGRDRKSYRVAKFGSLARSEAMDAQITEVGRADGIVFKYEKISRTSNTFPAHRLMWLAEREGDAEKLADLLFTAYFTDGQDIGDRSVLLRLASEAGLEAGRIEAFLDSDEGVAEVRGLEMQAYRAGIDGVPHFRIGEFELVGAQAPALLAEAIRRTAGIAASAA
jgi:predicted DsbA family dithiol-disulfide isomerase